MCIDTKVRILKPYFKMILKLNRLKFSLGELQPLKVKGNFLRVSYTF